MNIPLGTLELFQSFHHFLIKLTFEDSCEEESQDFDKGLWGFYFLDNADQLFEGFHFLLWVTVLLNGELIEVEGHGVEAVDVLFLKEVGEGGLRLIIVPHSPQKVHCFEIDCILNNNKFITSFTSGPQNQPYFITTSLLRVWESQPPCRRWLDAKQYNQYANDVVYHNYRQYISEVSYYNQIQILKKMQAEPQPDRDVQATVLLQIGQVYMHRLLRKQKSLFTSGNFRIAKLVNNDGNPVHFLNLNSFYYGIQQNSFFIKVVYPETTAYVFPHFENGLSAISIPTNPGFMQPLDQLLSQVSRLYELGGAMEVPEIKNLIEEHYPTIERQQIFCPDNIKKAITETGSFLNKAFTALGGYLKTGVEKAGTYIDSKVSQGEPTQLSENTKTRWESLKEGTNRVFTIGGEYAGRILKPVITKTKEYSNQLGDKINQSNNNSVKYAKELATISTKALGQAFDGILKGGKEFTTELGNQSTKIITKKYGPDVVNTITGKKEEPRAAEQPAGQMPQQPKPEGEAKEEQESEVRLNNRSSQNLYPSLDEKKEEKKEGNNE